MLNNMNIFSSLDVYLTVILALAALLAVPSAGSDEASPKPSDNRCRLILPERIQAVVGREANIYFDNIMCVPNPRAYPIDITCDKGTQQNERWTFVPEPSDVGEWPLQVSVRDGENRPISTAKTIVRVIPADAGAGRDVSWLMIGDSLTHAGVYPEAILNLCKTPGNPRVTLLGTHHTAGTSTENLHEGYGGWTFERFATCYSPNSDPEDHANRGSPFVFLRDGKPVLDFKRYVSEKLAEKTPDLITIALGTNDIFSANDDNIEGVIDGAFVHADALLSSIRVAAPAAKIGLVMIVPPAATQDAFGGNYGCGQTRLQYRRNQHRYIERMKEKYGGREKDGLSLIPAFTNIDTAHNYPCEEVTANSHSSVRIIRQSNGVHPADSGYRQMADTIYCWMKEMADNRR